MAMLTIEYSFLSVPRWICICTGKRWAVSVHFGDCLNLPRFISGKHNLCMKSTFAPWHFPSQLSCIGKRHKNITESMRRTHTYNAGLEIIITWLSWWSVHASNGFLGEWFIGKNTKSLFLSEWKVTYLQSFIALSPTKKQLVLYV